MLGIGIKLNKLRSIRASLTNWLIKLNGTSQYIQLPFALSGDIYFSCYISTTTTNADYIIDARDASGDGFYCSIGADGKLSFKYNTATIKTSTSAYNDGVARLLEVIITSTTYAVKMNGVTVISGTGTGAISTTTNARIGCTSYVLGNYLDARLWDISVSDNTKTANYPCNEGAGTVLNDTSGGGHNASLVGSPTWEAR